MMSDQPLVGVSAAELADCLHKTVAHLIECERQLDEFHGLGADAGAGVSVIVCDAQLMLKRFHADPDVTSQRSAVFEQLLNQVRKTCGQSNCNCVGSNQIKQLVRDLGITTPVQRGAR